MGGLYPEPERQSLTLSDLRPITPSDFHLIVLPQVQLKRRPKAEERKVAESSVEFLQL